MTQLVVHFNSRTAAASSGQGGEATLVLTAVLSLLLMVYFASVGLGQVFVWLVATKPRWFGGE